MSDQVGFLGELQAARGDGHVVVVDAELGVHKATIEAAGATVGDEVEITMSLDTAPREDRPDR